MADKKCSCPPYKFYITIFPQKYFYSTLIIRYPTPICVWIYCGESSVGSNFLRNVAINTRKEAISVSQFLPQIFSIINVWVRTFPTFLESKHNSLYSIGVKCNSLSLRKWLCQIIIRACIQCLYLIIILTSCTDNNNRHIGPWTNIIYHFYSVHIR